MGQERLREFCLLGGRCLYELRTSPTVYKQTAKDFFNAAEEQSEEIKWTHDAQAAELSE